MNQEIKEVVYKSRVDPVSVNKGGTQIKSIYRTVSAQRLVKADADDTPKNIGTSSAKKGSQLLTSNILKLGFSGHLPPKKSRITSSSNNLRRINQNGVRNTVESTTLDLDLSQLNNFKPERQSGQYSSRAHKGGNSQTRIIGNNKGYQSVKNVYRMNYNSNKSKETSSIKQIHHPTGPDAPQIKVYTRQLNPMVKSINKFEGDENPVSIQEIKRSTYHNTNENVELYKRQLQSMRKANNQLEANQEKLRNQIRSLEMTNHNLRSEKMTESGKFTNLRREKESYLKRLEDREEEYQRINLENSELLHKLSVAEDKICNLQSCLEQSNSQKFELDATVKNLREQNEIYVQLQQDMKNENHDFTNKLDGFKANYDDRLQAKDKDIESLEEKVHQLQEQIRQFQLEKTEYGSTLDSKDHTISSLQRQLEQLTDKITNNESVRKTTELKLEKLRNEYGCTTEEKFKFEQEIMTLNNKVKNLEADKKERENDILKLIQESERLSNELRSKSSGNVNFTHKIEELQLTLTTETNRFNDKLKDLNAQLTFKDELIQSTNDKAFEQRRLKEEAEGMIRSLENSNTLLGEQNERIKKDLLNCEQKLNEATNRIHQLEISMKQARNERKSHIVQNDSSKVTELSREIQRLKNRLTTTEQDYTSKLKIKSDGISKLKLSTSELENRIKELTKENSNLSGQNNLLTSENDKIKQLYQKSQESLSSLEGQISDLSRNNNILVNQIKELEKINKQLKEKINEDLLIKIQKLEAESYQKDTLVHKLESEVKQVESQKKSLKMNNKELKNSIVNLENDLDRLRNLIQVLEAENRDYKVQVNPLLEF